MVPWALAVSLSFALTRAHSAGPNSSAAIINAGCLQNDASFSNTQVIFTLSHDLSAIDVGFQGEGSVSGNATFHIWLYSQSQVLRNRVYDPCLELTLAEFCPFAEGPFNVSMNLEVQLDGTSLPDAGALELAVTTDSKAALTCVEDSIQGGSMGGSMSGPDQGSSMPSSNFAPGNGGSSDAFNGTSASNADQTPDDSSSGSPPLAGWQLLL